jgi:predicted MPP superfamily phosphohydrolase
MRSALLAALLIILAATALAAGTFAFLEGLPLRPWMAVSMAVTVAFLPSSLLSWRMNSRWVGAINVLSGIALGFVSYFALAALASWAAWAAFRLAGHSDPPTFAVSLIYAAAAAAGGYGLISAYWIRLTRVDVRLEGLPASWAGKTLALVTDVHLGNFRGRGFSRRVVARLAALHAEAVLIGGDLFDGVRIDTGRVLEPWKALRAPSGVYFVGGNHDDYGGRQAYFQAIREAGIRVLDNERILLHGLQLVGVHDLETHQPADYYRTLAGMGLEPAKASVLLAHRPSHLEVPERAGIGLQLSGHTHRGQFWPWTLIADRVHGKFAYGLNRQGRLQVYTSSGVGTWGPPFRVGTRAEIVLIRLAAT